jgi:hypothetical protein
MIGMNPFSGFGQSRPVAKPAGMLAPALLDPDPDTGALVPPVKMAEGMKPLPPIDGMTMPTVTGQLLEPHMEPTPHRPSPTDPIEDKSPRSLLQQTEEYQQMEPQRKKVEEAAKTQGAQQAQPQYSGYQIQSDPLQVLDLGLRYQPSQYRR